MRERDIEGIGRLREKGEGRNRALKRKRDKEGIGRLKERNKEGTGRLRERTRTNCKLFLLFS